MAPAWAPPRRSNKRPELSPLTHAGLPEDDGAGPSEPPNHARVAGDDGTDQGEGAGGRVEPVPGSNAVFEKDRDAVKASAVSSGSPLAVSLVRLAKRVGVQLDHGVESGVQDVDSVDVVLDELAGGESSGAEG